MNIEMPDAIQRLTRKVGMLTLENELLQEQILRQQAELDQLRPKIEEEEGDTA